MSDRILKSIEFSLTEIKVNFDNFCRLPVSNKQTNQMTFKTFQPLFENIHHQIKELEDLRKPNTEIDHSGQYISDEQIQAKETELEYYNDLIINKLENLAKLKRNIVIAENLYK